MNRDKKLLIIFFPDSCSRRNIVFWSNLFRWKWRALEVHAISRNQISHQMIFFFSHQNDLWLSVFVFSIRLSVCSSVLTWKILSSCVQILKWELETLGTNLLLKNSLEWNHFWWNFGLITRWALYYISLWMFKSHSKHSFGKT